MATGQSNLKYLPPKQQGGWFGRNCLWFVPLMALLFGGPLFCCIGGGGLLSGIFSLAAAITEPRDAALEALQDHPEIVAKLGEPIKAGANINISQLDRNIGSGSCTLEFDVSGPNGKANVYGEMVMESGDWSPDGLRVTCDDGSEFILPEGATVPRRKDDVSLDFGNFKITVNDDDDTAKETEKAEAESTDEKDGDSDDDKTETDGDKSDAEQNDD